jgi:16S rRNA processing protein RimM
MEGANVRQPKGRLHAADPWMEIGEVVRSHGLDGSLLVSLYGDDAQNLTRAKSVLLRGPAGALELGVVDVRPSGRAPSGRARALVRLEGISSSEEASEWAGALLCIPESALSALPPGEFYWRDLIGLACRTLDGETVGTVEELWPTAANDVLVVRKGARSVLVPAVREILTRIDLEEGVVWIDPPPGLIEETP